MTPVDDINKLKKDLTQLARLALQGKQRDVDVFVRRLTKRYEHLAPELSEELALLLRNAPAKPASGSVLRGGAVVERMPVDLDSRLSLARVENPVHLDREPHWSADVTRKLNELVFERQHEDELIKENLQPSHTALFTGPPGVGKTLAARWIALQLGRPLVTLDLAAVMSSFLGRTGNNVRNVLDYAKGIPCVFLLDEFDAIAKRRDDVVEVGELKRLVTVLLQEIDSWPTTGLLIAATNHDDLLDPAVWRRFELIVKFPMPADVDVRRAVETYLGDVEIGEHWVRVLARVFVGSSYADIERELKRVRRQAVIQKDPLESRLKMLVAEHADSMKRGDRAHLALALVQAGLSQREAHEWTGVSRDTIRKHQEARR
jgi:SpoVK/Ycf46/Vps4 family AAA+-type ATPase